MIPKVLYSMLVGAGLLAAGAFAQSPAQPPASSLAGSAASDDKTTDKQADSSATGPLAPLAWVHGCWGGKVNQRDFREEWLPPGGDMMVGVSQTTLRGKTVDFEYLRLETRPEGIFYV